MALVLIVDDVLDGRELMARVLHQVGGHETITADDGRRALDLVAERHPSLVLLDIAMPGMDGFEVLHRLRARHKGSTLPVVMYTAFGDAAHRKRAEALGAAGYFVKGTLDLDRLLEMIDALTNSEGAGNDTTRNGVHERDQ